MRQTKINFLPLNLKIAVVLLIACLVAIGLLREVERLADQGYRRDQELAATLQLVEMRESIQREVFGRILKLQEFSTLVSEKPDITEPELSPFAERFLAQNPDVISIGIAPDLVITMVFPIAGNEAAIGLDYRSIEEQFPKVQEAMRTGSGLVTGPVDLVQGGQGLILRQPVFMRQPGQQGLVPWGLISIVVDYNIFVDSLNIPQIEDRYELVIAEQDVAGGMDHFFYGASETLSANPARLGFDFPFGRWELAALPKGGWAVHRPGYILARVVAFGFVAFALLTLWYVMGLSETRRLAELRFRQAIDALADGFVLFDKSTRIVAFNSKFEELHRSNNNEISPGMTYDEMVRSGIKAGMFKDAIGDEEQFLQKHAVDWDGGDRNSEISLGDGRSIVVSDRLMPDGSTVGLRIDVTNLKKALRDAEAADKAKSDFMAVLSHELRTPLTVMLGMARLSKQIERLPVAKELRSAIAAQSEADQVELNGRLGALTDSVSDMMCKLEKSGEHLLSLINEILEFAKMDASGLQLDLQPEDFASIATTATDQLAPMIEQKGLEFEINVDSCPIEVDAKRIKQVMMNFLGNAAKFTKEGQITLNARKLDNRLRVEVCDTGVGIAQEEVAKVFDPFHQVENPDTRGIGGTGLGLAISKEIIEAHRGTLGATSVVGEGSVFFFELPLNGAGSLDYVESL